MEVDIVAAFRELERLIATGEWKSHPVQFAMLILQILEWALEQIKRLTGTSTGDHLWSDAGDSAELEAFNQFCDSQDIYPQAIADATPAQAGGQRLLGLIKLLTQFASNPELLALLKLLLGLTA